MLPLYAAGLTLAGKALLSKYYGNRSPDKSISAAEPSHGPDRPTGRMPLRLFPEPDPTEGKIPYQPFSGPDRAEAGIPLRPFSRLNPPQDRTPLRRLPRSDHPEDRMWFPQYPSLNRNRRTAGAPNLGHALQTMLRDLSSTLSQITKKAPQEDYDAVIKSFIPAGASPFVPEYPAGSREYQFADLDGDSQNELITSYRLDDEVKTIILKKQNEQWHQIAEINHFGHNRIHFSGAADVTGEGRKQLLLGMTSEGKVPVLYGYSVKDNLATQQFAVKYHRFEVMEQPGSREAAARAELAVWHQKDADAYNIEVLHWNNSQLEPLEDGTPYFSSRVIPYYVQKVKQSPGTPSNWYNLAESLVKVGAYRDALVAIEMGLGQGADAVYREKFLALRKGITG